MEVGRRDIAVHGLDGRGGIPAFLAVQFSKEPEDQLILWLAAAIPCGI